MSGIYIHIPFCKQACYYCDFHFSTSLKKKEDLLNALVREMELRKDECMDEIDTIYFGGGTPSLLYANEIRELIDAVYSNFKVTEDPEITLEANPDDLDISKLNEFAHTSINRLSIGIQSFFDEDLNFMNRAHSAAEANQSLEQGLKLFPNTTIDLIYGVPGMSDKRWEQNLEKAIDFGVPHISSYALTVEPKTALESFIKKGIYPAVDENCAQRHFTLLISKLESAGFVQYEISNFGKPGFYSQHNSSYWKGVNYLGIGPSAHSFNGRERSWNVKNNNQYIKSISTGVLPKEREMLNERDMYNEYLMIGLRTIWGVSLSKVERDFGSEYKVELTESIKRFVNTRLLEIDYKDDPLGTIKLTSKGKFLADGIASDLFLLN